MNWEEARRNRTQLEKGNYPALHCDTATWRAIERKCRRLCNVTIQDAVWLLALAGIDWQAQAPVKKAPAKSPSTAEEQAVAQWLLSHKISWERRFGVAIADALATYIKESLANGKLKYVGAHNQASILEGLEKEAQRKINSTARLIADMKEIVNPATPLTNLFQAERETIGLDPAQPGADHTAYQILDRNARPGQPINIKPLTVTGTLPNWKRTSSGCWYRQLFDGALEFAAGRANTLLEDEWIKRGKPA